MSKATDIWFPVYIGDYTSATMHLTTEQHGAYFLLLMAAWKSNGFLPDDDDQLAAICRLSPDRWEKTRRVIAGFWIIEGGRWSQKRLTAELEKAKVRKNVASANGAHGGRPKKPDGLSAGNPLGYPEHNPNHNPQKSSSPSPSTVLKPPISPTGLFGPLWEASIECFGKPTTYPEEQRARQGVEELVRIGASPDDLRLRVENYRKGWPNMPCTLKAILKNWNTTANLKGENNGTAKQRADSTATDRIMAGMAGLVQGRSRQALPAGGENAAG